MPAEPGSIADYDIVLSISEEAINRQLQLLYNKPVGGSADLPPPIPTPNSAAAPPPQSEYLINHELVIHLKDDDGNVDEKSGIKGHVECPTVKFTNVGTGSGSPSARISYKFKSDPSAGDAADSVFNYWSGFGPSAKLKSLNINGFTMFWQANLQRADIMDVMKG
jgi:hypothetical protein